MRVFRPGLAVLACSALMALPASAQMSGPGDAIACACLRTTIDASNADMTGQNQALAAAQADLARLDQQIIAPQSIFTTPDFAKLTLPPGVFQSQFIPQLNNILINPQRINFFEPASTFRFAVSRTF